MFGARLAILGAVALAIRLLYVLVIAPAPVGLDGDWHFYHSSANLLAQGHFYYRGIFGRAWLTAEHPPLYTMVLGSVAWLGGTGIVAQRIVGCVLGSASVVLFGLVGRRLRGEGTGVAAAAIAAVYPPLVVVDGALMSEPLLVFVVLVALLVAYRLLERPSVGTAAALGALIGLATLAHSEALLLAPLLLIPTAWRTPVRRPGRILASIAACGLVLAPWLVRNQLDFHRLTLATNSNTVIAGANCRQTYYGNDIGWWRLDCEARGRTFKQLVQGDANTTSAIHYVKAHPARAALVSAVRVLRTFSFFQPLREGNGQIRRRWFDIVGLVIYYPLLLLAALGLRRLEPGRRWPLIALVLVSVIVSAIDSGLPRLRIPADVGLIVLGAVALSAWPRRWRPPPREPAARAASPASNASRAAAPHARTSPP